MPNSAVTCALAVSTICAVKRNNEESTRRRKREEQDSEPITIRNSHEEIKGLDHYENQYRQWQDHEWRVFYGFQVAWVIAMFLMSCWVVYETRKLR